MFDGFDSGFDGEVIEKFISYLINLINLFISYLINLINSKIKFMIKTSTNFSKTKIEIRNMLYRRVKMKILIRKIK